MATIRRTDIIQKKYSKGRPAKTKREISHKRQEAYKWRDARRVYLASSFDKWRKLRSTLKMKDSSLAWHLMEAHEKSPCTICRQLNSECIAGRQNISMKNNKKEFLPSLIASVRQLCHRYFDFEDSIEIVGLLCLEFDKCRKENFSLNELIKSGLKPAVSSFISESLQDKSSLSNHAINTNLLFQNCEDVQLTENSDTCHKQQSALPCLLNKSDIYAQSNEITKTADTMDHNDGDFNRLSVNELVQNTCPLEIPLLVSVKNNNVEVNKDIESIEYTEVVEDDSISKADCSSNSDTDPSLEIDIEKMDTSQEEETEKTDSQRRLSKNERLLSSENVGSNIIPEESCEDSSLNCVKFVEKSSETYVECQSEKTTDTALESPLDMSMLKSTVKQEPDIDMFDHRPFTEDSDGVHQQAGGGTLSDSLAHQTHHHNKKKVIDLDHTGSNKHSFWNEHFPTKFGKHKDEMHAGIPWQRRDMSRKEEYEYLEFHPFCDLAEFSQHYPHVHQRTYYRWKRRIKEEFIILEQCPDMSFQEFTSIVLQAKESVYHLWKSLISQGKGFFTPCDSSKRLEAKCSNKPVSHGHELSFLQKNLSINYDQFCQQYPGISLDIFNVMKRKVMQEFWLYYQNQHMSFKDLSKLVNITEEVFVVWKDYVENLKSSSLSPSLKSAAAVLSPSPSIPATPFQHLDSPKSSTANMHPHLSEDRILNIINGGSPFTDSGSTGLNTSLNESIARNLSASYIASLQSMMFPWHSYYGMTSPLGQQILPMMLWPQMIGLSNSLNLIPGSNSASAALTSLQLPPVSNSESPAYETKSDDTNNKPQSIKFQGTKRSATDESDDATLNCDKKLKVSYEKEDADYWGSISRSRKQNKQEYVYYLKNPELGFKELESLFPSISLRTFYRWRKEMNAAVLLLEDNKDMTYHQFQMVFPDIPEEVFDLWKDKSDKNSALYASKVDLSIGDGSSQNDVYADVTNQPVKAVKERHESSENTATSFKATVNDDTTHHRKYNKEEYIFVQKNPDIDFATFSKLYPNISVRSFYRWKKELKDSVEYLKGNPSITYDVFRSMDSSATEEIFNIWKTLACNEYLFEDPNNEISEIQEDKELKPLGLTNRKYNGPEYNFLQLNPYIEFSQFSRTYPDVPKRTFYRWKREIQQIINYIRAQPCVNFSDISTILPEVSQEVFHKWKETVHYLADGSADNNNADIMQVSESEQIFFNNADDETARNKMTDALLYLMRHPTISFRQFSTQFDYVLPITFELWLKRIQKVLMHIASNPNITYSSFSSNIKDITEDIFDIWKNLGPADMAAIEVSCENVQKTNKKQGLDITMTGIEATSFVSEDILQKAFEYCQNNPSVTDKVFHLHFPGISTNLFNEWKLQINDEINFIKCNPEITFEEFTKHNPHITRDIFNIWKYQSLFKVEEDFHKNLSQTAVDADQNTHVESVTGQASCVKVELDADLITHDNQVKHDKLENVNYEGEMNKTETCDAESSLIKLTKFADKRGSSGEKSSVASDLFNHRKKSLKNISVAENMFKNNNTIGLHVQSEMSPSNVEGLLHSSNSAGSYHQLYNKTGPLLEAYGSNLLSSAASNSSLSALMAMSGNSDACNPTSQEKLTPKKEPVQGSNWQGSTWGYVKDEDEAFSSQRQKKMSRAEYMFVKDNPDVDSQEFSRIFPQVSARTFYRWKKEIKAQLQMA